MNYKIKVLDDFEIIENGKKLKFPYKKVAILFVYLIINKKASRIEIANLLWENTPETEMRKNLRNALYTLKKLTNDDIVIISDKNSIFINDNFNFDIDFNLIDNQNDNRVIVDNFGLFLKNISFKELSFFEEWVSEQRSKLLMTYLDACDALVSKYEDENKLNLTLEVLHKKIKYFEYDEEAYRKIMNIYLLKKQYNNAIEIYKYLTNVLGEDLNVDVEPETANLYEKIISNKLVRNLDDDNLDINSTNLTHLNKVVNEYDKLINSSSFSSYLIVGNSGVGKTYFVDCFLKKVSTKQVDVIKLICNENDNDYVFNNIARLVDELASKYKTLNFEQLFSLSTKKLNVNNDVNLQYQNFTDYFVKLLKTILEKNKIVLVIENMHQMSTQCFILYKKLIDEKLSNLMMIFTCRCHSDYHVKHECLFKREKLNTYRINLLAWSSDEVKEYLFKNNSSKSVTQEYIKTVMDETNGNPRLVKNFVNAQSSDNYDVFFHQIFRNLNDTEQKVLYALSIYKDGVSLEEIKILTSLNELELIDIFDKLIQLEIIIALESNAGVKYIYATLLFKQYVYASIDSQRKKQLHTIVARHIESTYNMKVSSLELYQILIEHYSYANNKQKELEYTIRYHSLKNYCRCELFPIVDKEYLNDLYFDELENYQLFLESLEFEINNILDSSIIANDFKESLILFYMIKARYYLRVQNNEIAFKTIAKLMTYDDDSLDINQRLNMYYLYIYYALNINDTKLMLSMLQKINNVLNKLDPYSLIYLKTSVSYYRFKGYYNILEKNYVKARSDLESALELYNKSTFEINKTYIASVYHYIGHLELAEENYQRSIDAFSICLSYLETDKLLNDAIIITKGFLSIAYYLNNAIDSSLVHGREYKDLQYLKSFSWKDELFNSSIDSLLYNDKMEIKEFNSSYDRMIFDKIVAKDAGLINS